ncbi:MAG: hypothetical protein ACRCYU_07095 [Nocardioides sp.]
MTTSRFGLVAVTIGIVLVVPVAVFLALRGLFASDPSNYGEQAMFASIAVLVMVAVRRKMLRDRE